jgi:hypothetical protein
VARQVQRPPRHPVLKTVITWIGGLGRRPDDAIRSASVPPRPAGAQSGQC